MSFECLLSTHQQDGIFHWLLNAQEVSHEVLGDDPQFKTQMAEDPELWRRRPLPQRVVEYVFIPHSDLDSVRISYALSGCLHLIPLYHAIQSRYLTSTEAMTDAIEYSDHWVKIMLELL